MIKNTVMQGSNSIALVQRNHKIKVTRMKRDKIVRTKWDNELLYSF